MADDNAYPEPGDEPAELRSRLAAAEETLRQWSARSLGEGEARYRELFESNPQPMWVYDLETLAFLAVNDAAVAHYGYRREEFLRMTILDLHPPGKRFELAETVRHVPGPMRRVGVWPQIRKDGAIRDVEITTHDVSFAGRAARLVLSNDITERKRAEDALRASQQLIEGIVNAIPVRVFWKDRSLVYLGCNAAFARDAGFADPKEVIGKDDFQMGWREQALLYRNDDLQVMESGDPKFLIEEPQTTPDGKSITLLTSKVPLLNSEGQISGVIGTYIDITERKRLAEEKARLEAQLRQVQKVEAIGRLAGGIAHDFNNLTAIVIGFGELVLGQMGADDPARKWAEQIVEAGRRSATLTRQLLAFSRRQVLLPVVLDFNDLLRKLEAMLCRLIGEDVSLELKLAPGVGCITADPGQIEQVVTNLVINARDAMPLGGKLTFETADVELDEAFAREHADVVPGRYVMLALTDTGCGMDQATLARIFEPFFTTKEQGKGTGLGLATAFGVIKQSGGYLYVSSEPGRGTIFTIYLPWTDAKPKARPSKDCGETPQRGNGERILLVEDEAPLRELCGTHLSRLGYQVVAAGTGPEALAIVEEQGFSPDLLLTDVVMPGMSGAELAGRLRRDRPGLKVLYMSGYPDGTIASHGVLKPGTAFLQKPFPESALAANVRDALGLDPAAAQPGRRVLMIDDDRQFIDLMAHLFRKRGHSLVGATSAVAALAALARHDFDLLLVDLNIPGTSGEHVLREIRAAGHVAPAIVLTGDVASADMARLRPLGAMRVLEKSQNAEPLLHAIEQAATAGDI